MDFFFVELYSNSTEPLAELTKKAQDQPDTDVHLHERPLLDARDRLSLGEGEYRDQAQTCATKLATLT